MTAATRKGMLDLTPNAITVLERRYLVKDDHGAPVEGPEDLFWRGVAPPGAPPQPAGGVAPAGLTALRGPLSSYACAPGEGALTPLHYLWPPTRLAVSHALLRSLAT